MIKYMFSKEDFQGDTKVKIACIVMNRINQPPLKRFSQLLNKDKRLFNEKLNEFIHSLPEQDWLKHVDDQFNTVINDEIFNENFIAEKYDVITQIQ